MEVVFVQKLAEQGLELALTNSCNVKLLIRYKSAGCARVVLIAQGSKTTV